MSCNSTRSNLSSTFPLRVGKWQCDWPSEQLISRKHVPKSSSVCVKPIGWKLAKKCAGPQTFLAPSGLVRWLDISVWQHLHICSTPLVKINLSTFSLTFLSDKYTGIEPGDKDKYHTTPSRRFQGSHFIKFDSLKPSDECMCQQTYHHWFRLWLVAWLAPRHHLN